jgi:hypothetical protein
MDFPHSCFPGNSRQNGGVGTGTGTAGFAYNVNLKKGALTNQVDMIIAKNPTCNPTWGCCNVNMEKVEFVINPLCRNTILKLEGTDKSPSYATNSWPSMPPPGYPGTTATVGKVTGLCPGSPGSCPQALRIQITLDPDNVNCNTPEKFFYMGKFWFAAFGSTPGNENGCCGAGN